MVSTFKPISQYPEGCWLEEINGISVEPGVAIENGGWKWLPRKTKIGKTIIPGFLTPKANAGKSIVSGKYQFHVEIAYPLLDTLLSYRGLLDLQTGEVSDIYK